MQNEDGRRQEWLMALPNLGKLLVRLTRDPRVPRRHKIIMGLVGAYAIAPADLVPDWIPVVGRLDDLALFVIALDGMLNRVPAGIVAEHWDGDPEVLETIRKVLGRATDMIPGRVHRRLFLGARG